MGDHIWLRKNHIRAPVPGGIAVMNFVQQRHGSLRGLVFRPTSRYLSRAGFPGTGMGMAVARDQLLDSALQVVSQEGFGAMTLDAVARAAGVSKGGLIHHFPSKDALIVGMLDYFGERLERELDRRAAQDPLMTGRRVRAMMQIAFPWLEPTSDQREASTFPLPDRQNSDPSRPSDCVRMLLAMITAAAVNRDLLKPLHERARQMIHRMLAQDPDGDWQLLTWLAVDGMMLWQYLGLLPGDDPLREQLIRRLYAMTKQPPPRIAEVAP